MKKNPPAEPTSPVILNADEACSWLKIPRSTLYKLCSDGELPATKVGRHWRFRKDMLEKWFVDRTSAPPSKARRPRK